MCDQHSLNEILSDQCIHSIRHPKEKKFFYIIACITIFFFSLVFAGTFFRDEIQDSIQENIVTDYRDSLSENEKNAVTALNDQEVLEKIPSDDKEILDFLNSYYYWYIVLGLPVGFFLLMLYQIGKMYGENRANGVLLTKNQYPVVYEVFEDLAKRADFKEVPDLFLIKGNGTINAYATCVPEYRDFAAVYSDLIDDCLKNNDFKTLRMVSDMNSDIFVTIM
ncbi:MAG: hypothetical protein Q4A35_04460 [Candidatus Gracilibacteria bacterium]|nr:hypothetical protein [Candidatus Gracilibacteria bacterium]